VKDQVLLTYEHVNPFVTMKWFKRIQGFSLGLYANKSSALKGGRVVNYQP